MRKAHMWSGEEKKYLSKITPGHHHKEIQELMIKKFNYEYTIDQIKGAITRYKLNTGFTGYFPKGNIPFNKGNKGVCAKGSEKTWFKKGHEPVNHRPVGSERVNVEGYREIKVAEPNKWKLKHRLVWEKEKGSIPKGYTVIFGDGNKENLDINNLILVSRSELLIMNKRNLIKKDIKLTKAGRNIAKLIDKTNKLNKEG